MINIRTLTLALLAILASAQSLAVYFDVQCPPDEESLKKIRMNIIVKHSIDGIILQSSDDKCLIVDDKSVKQSKTISDLLGDERMGHDHLIPLPNVDYKTLKEIAHILSEIEGKPLSTQIEKVSARFVYLTESKYGWLVPDVVKKKIYGEYPSIADVAASANFLDIRLENAEHALVETVFDVGLEAIRRRIFVDDVKRIGYMKAQEYQDYKEKVLAPLDKINKENYGALVQKGLRGSIYRFMSPVETRQMAMAYAQIVAYMVSHYTDAFGLPPVLKAEWRDSPYHQTLNNGRFQSFDYVRYSNQSEAARAVLYLPDPCPVPGHPNYHPNAYRPLHDWSNIEETYYETYDGKRVQKDPEELRPIERFVDNNNGTFTEGCTKLMWETRPSAKQFVWSKAKEHCDKLNLGGFNDWHLATIAELRTLPELKKFSSSTGGGEQNAFWSSSLNKSVGPADNDKPFGFSLEGEGYFSSAGAKYHDGMLFQDEPSSSYRALCVR